MLRRSLKVVAQWTAAGLPMVVALLMSAADARATNGKAITKCSEIKKAGFYLLKNDLTGTAAGCLKISASNVTLDGNRKTITGVGSATGLLVTGGSVFFNRLTVKNFAIGVQINSANVFGETFFAQNNTDTGLFLNGASNGRFYVFNADHNTNINVHLKSATGNSFLSGITNGGGHFGFWFESSSNNTAEFLSASGCDNTAIYLGCSGTGPSGQCASSGTSNGNKFADASVSTCPIGFAIDAGNLGNVITRLGANTSQDGNAACGSNLWFGNTITAADQACEN